MLYFYAVASSTGQHANVPRLDDAQTLAKRICDAEGKVVRIYSLRGMDAELVQTYVRLKDGQIMWWKGARAEQDRQLAEALAEMQAEEDGRHTLVQGA